MSQGTSREEHAVTVVTNADVRTMATPSVCTALAFRGERLIAVGSDEAVRAAAGSGAAVHDAAGATVVPGFIDAHQHPSIAALYGAGVPLGPPGASDIPGLQRRLSVAAKATESAGSGAWLVGVGWDEAQLAERRAPTRLELDAAVPDRPVFALHYSCHRAVANTRALELAGIGRDTAEPSGGVISRDRSGMPDGLLLERAMSPVESLARAHLATTDVDGFIDRLDAHYDGLVQAGITRIADAAAPTDLIVLYREAQRRGKVTVPTVLMPVSVTGYLEGPGNALKGPVTGERDGLLTMGPVKMVLDGAPACALCLSWWQAASSALAVWSLSVRTRSLDPLRTSLSVKPRLGRDVRSGIALFRPDEMHDIASEAVARGFSVACHAEGNLAIDIALAGYEKIGPRLHRAGTARLEHVLFADRALCDRMSGLGAAAVVQPYFLSLPGLDSAPPIPGLPTIPLRTLLDAGVVVSGSSDYPVTHFDPLDGIRSAVSRKTRNGVREPDQAVSLDEAFAMYTRGSAQVLGCLSECGTLEAGKRADLVLLDRRVSAESALANARVSGTVVGGSWLFGAPP